MKDRAERPTLRLINCERHGLPRLTGEDILKEAADMLATFFASRLAELPEEDPWRPTIEGLASQCQPLACGLPPA